MEWTARAHRGVHYGRLFGRVLASDLECPELLPAQPGESDWMFVARDGPVPTDPMELVGSEPVTHVVQVVLRASRGRFRLEYDDTGVFEISDAGRSIVWYPPTDHRPDLEHVRADLLGRVIGVALHAAGVPTLHGSAVVVDGRATLFLAPKLVGKSTTAGALVRAGARLISDDTIALLPGEPPMVPPGVGTLLLRQDSADWLQAGDADGATNRKLRVDASTLGARADAPTPLGAVYILSPAPSTAAEVTRDRLSPLAATVSLVGQAKIGRLLGRYGAGGLLEQCARVANAVPVYRLTIPWGLHRLDDVVRRMAEWHDADLRVTPSS